MRQALGNAEQHRAAETWRGLPHKLAPCSLAARMTGKTAFGDLPNKAIEQRVLDESRQHDEVAVRERPFGRVPRGVSDDRHPPLGELDHLCHSMRRPFDTRSP